MKVTLVMAQTLDGRIAKDSDHFPDWTGKADKKFFSEITKKAGVLIMGSKTYDTIGRPLPGRKNIIFTLEDRSSDHPDLVFTHEAPEKLLENLESQGFSHVILAGGMTINSLFARRNLIDEVIVTVSPLIFGRGLGVFASDVEMKLKLEKFEALDENVISLYYQVLKSVNA